MGFRQLKIKLVQRIKEKLFKGKHSPSFPYLPENSRITTGAEELRAYPEKTFLASQGAYAYHLLLVIPMTETPTLLNLLESQFAITSLTQESAKNSNQESIFISSRMEFGGLLVEMTTNSVELLTSIDSIFQFPPPPWIAFPYIDPIEITLPKQGSLEYWYDHIWSPYWSSRSDKEKLEFLENTPLEWKEFINQS